MKNQKVLVSGASIAGLSTAWWMNYLGYQVSLVELAPLPRTNGAAVDLNAQTVEIVKRMGLYEQLKAHQLGVDQIEYKNAENVTEGCIVIDRRGETQNDEIEIERHKFVEVMMAALQGKVNFKFNDSIIGLKEFSDRINVSFKGSSSQDFDIVLGGDGSHSGTRKIWFGPETDYSHFLGAYFSISIIPKLLVPERNMQTYSVPYKSVMLNSYNRKTDIIFIFLSDNDIPYDYRDVAHQRTIMEEQFSGIGWRSAELLQEIQQEPDFYFDRFCQIKMPSWSKGRVALIGDAAYCPSPASGQGGSLAIQGAAAVADALLKNQGNFREAFAEFERVLRPHIEEIQNMAEQNLKTNFVLRSEEAIRKRNTEAALF
ncbi:2-polyprenyl-6-methoxyphenol hydroxylase-like FAD-dependent oxidoreductase [Pedobacter sp. AK017]|uniref:FAD-dependent monooxygenase n=1 Tax=Pedobacter sp. AK017 TaxID=2723073 RepID=UPI00160CB3E1|nr:FAD-dependent monooxygenase [Pedobacter sp. AK017]MBB5438900.1 2-polyprenyl-6-methoxyphenol hydroxylase-like FAD-dependent oxidoreductase [Pedobacter sp. AK017]